jgi:iron complex transport system substrate-binding protein
VKNKIKYIFCILLLVILSASCHNRNQQPGQERRIISLAPHITEIIYALGADHDLVAVTTFCKYPVQAQQKEKIGGLFDPNIEKLVSLRPTLLLGTPAHQKLAHDLQQFNLPVVMLPDETVADIIHTIDTLGQILGYVNQAQNLIGRINQDIHLLHSKKLPYQPLTAMLVIGKESGSLQNLMVAGRETFLNELWTMAGGINVFADLPVNYSTVNLESIIQRNPQVIIQFDPDRPAATAAGIYTCNDEPEWQYLQEVDAVKKGNLYIIGGDYVFIPGPRFSLLAQEFNKIIEQAIR